MALHIQTSTAVPFRVVLAHDPAMLRDIPMPVLERYVLTHDIADLAPHAVPDDASWVDCVGLDRRTVAMCEAGRGVYAARGGIRELLRAEAIIEACVLRISDIPLERSAHGLFPVDALWSYIGGLPLAAEALRELAAVIETRSQLPKAGTPSSPSPRGAGPASGRAEHTTHAEDAMGAVATGSASTTGD
jgi:hypothetical protein